MSKAINLKTLFFAAFVLIFGACAEKAGSGVYMTTPQVGIQCSSTRCKANVAGRAYVVFTTSSCTNPQFGETAAGSATVTCNGLGCTGTAASFTSPSIQEGFYSVCVIIDFNSNYVGAAIPGEDSLGTSANVNFVSGMTTTTVTSFIDN